MDSNLKTSYERMEKKPSSNVTTALKQNLISGESFNHQTCSRGRFYLNNDYLISYVYVNFLGTLRGKKLHVIQEFNNALKDKNLFHLPVN